MFHVQESILKLLFDSVISTINAKVDKLANSVATFKASLEYTHTIKKDEGDLSSSKSQLQGAEKDMDEIKTAMGLQENKKIEYLENQSGRNYSSVWNTRVGLRDVRSG